MIYELFECLREIGIVYPENLPLDGEVHLFNVAGKKGLGWIIATENFAFYDSPLTSSVMAWNMRNIRPYPAPYRKRICTFVVEANRLKKMQRAEMKKNGKLAELKTPAEDKKYEFLDKEQVLVDRELYQVPIQSLLPDPDRLNNAFKTDVLDGLRLSIAKSGVLRPVRFRMDTEGYLILAAGSHRLVAAQDAGLEKIPAIFMASLSSNVMSLVKQLNNGTLSPIAEAEALLRLKNEGGLKSLEVADLINRAESTVCEILSLNRLPKAIKEVCRNDKKIPRSALVQIARVGSAEEMIDLFNRYRRGDMAINDLRHAVNQIKSPITLQKNIEILRTRLAKTDLETFGNKRTGIEAKLRKLTSTVQGLLSP
ncbi:ParB-like nuclease domain-containing protein [Malonomonas rubra DSM 5091]|uniref:ParB-like nuclease domain-containing protein n=1 Tax=Malonomonas rubra DSM 5091 TaxID=1122189 RepID=A0A1M6H339_MALRU|nr:ParB/RepB/Spo0J family partition protein [Malonomonas rubra]SHJ16615.1 ParB-like nuclease domain-containing protein [Malonomonas rubra DSM 5091]